jgi:hypothetical protein
MGVKSRTTLLFKVSLAELASESGKVELVKVRHRANLSYHSRNNGRDL